jgi:hypothetical protein
MKTKEEVLGRIELLKIIREKYNRANKWELVKDIDNEIKILEWVLN